MLKDLVKIANRLDSLGLTKEADIIDSYLNKTATYDGASRYFKTPERMKIYNSIDSDVKSLGVDKLFSHLDDPGAAYSFAPVAFTSRGKGPSENGIAMANNLTSLINKYNFEDLESYWQANYILVFVGDYTLKSELSAWLTSINRQAKEYIFHYKEFSGGKYYDEALVTNGVDSLKKLQQALAVKGKVSLPLDDSAFALNPSTKKSPSVESKPPGPQATTTAPPAPTKTTPSVPEKDNSTPKPVASEDALWKAYSNRVGDTNMSIRKKWLERGEVKNRSKTYSNYQSWLSSATKVRGGGMNVQDVLAVLESEIKGAGYKKQVSERAPIDFTPAKDTGDRKAGFGLNPLDPLGRPMRPS